MFIYIANHSFPWLLGSWYALFHLISIYYVPTNTPETFYIILK